MAASDCVGRGVLRNDDIRKFANYLLATLAPHNEAGPSNALDDVKPNVLECAKNDEVKPSDEELAQNRIQAQNEPVYDVIDVIDLTSDAEEEKFEPDAHSTKIKKEN